MSLMNVRSDLICGMALSQAAGGIAFSEGCITEIQRTGLGEYEIITDPGIISLEIVPITQPFGNLLTHIESVFFVSSLSIRTYDISGAGAPVAADRQFYLILFKMRNFDVT